MTEYAARKGNTDRTCRIGQSVQTSLQAIANKARKCPNHRFRNLYGMLDEQILWEAWRRLNKRSAGGVDRVLAKNYSKDLQANLRDLASRLKGKRYRAKLVKRCYIPKGKGKTRPLGLPTLEDKLVQWGVTLILESIYEQDFRESSYGYRPARGAKDAVKKLTKELQFGNYRYVVEADIKGFFDHLDHQWLIKMLQQRIDDRAFTGLIKKWLKAGILDTDGKVISPVTGSPQGGIVSPVLANVYLHYVLDLWFDKCVKKHVKGKVSLTRYADDWVTLFELKEDVVRFYDVFPERLDKFGLAIATEKT